MLLAPPWLPLEIMKDGHRLFAQLTFWSSKPPSVLGTRRQYCRSVVAGRLSDAGPWQLLGASR